MKFTSKSKKYFPNRWIEKNSPGTAIPKWGYIPSRVGTYVDGYCFHGLSNVYFEID